MNLLDYCRACGIVIETLPPIGVWKRYPTTDKPAKKNGAVKYLGTFAHVQNLATMPECSTWKPDDNDTGPVIDHAEVARIIEKQRQEREHAAQKAAKLAAYILHNSRLETHPYLESKGFPLEQGNVWTRERDGERLKLLVIPMRVDGHLVGCQMIAPDGSKKFLTGQRTDGAVFVMDNRGRPIVCEGLATALSIRASLQAIRVRYKLICCFSANNMARVVATLPDAFMVADNDISGTGQRIATESGRPFFLPPVAGNDFNDWARNVGVFKASQALRIEMSKNVSTVERC